MLFTCAVRAGGAGIRSAARAKASLSVGRHGVMLLKARNRQLPRHQQADLADHFAGLRATIVAPTTRLRPRRVCSTTNLLLRFGHCPVDAAQADAVTIQIDALAVGFARREPDLQPVADRCRCSAEPQAGLTAGVRRTGRCDADARHGFGVVGLLGRKHRLRRPRRSIGSRFASDRRLRCRSRKRTPAASRPRSSTLGLRPRATRISSAINSNLRPCCSTTTLLRAAWFAGGDHRGSRVNANSLAPELTPE